MCHGSIMLYLLRGNLVSEKTFLAHRYLSSRPDKWDNIQLIFWCLWDSLHGTRIPNLAHSPFFQLGFHVHQRLKSANWRPIIKALQIMIWKYGLKLRFKLNNNMCRNQRWLSQIGRLQRSKQNKLKVCYKNSVPEKCQYRIAFWWDHNSGYLKLLKAIT